MTSINPLPHYYCNYDNGDEVIISNCTGEQQEVVADVAADAAADVAANAAADAEVCAQPKQQQSYKYDARFYFDEELYEKKYALAKLAEAQSQKALAEEKALAEVKAVEAEAKQASDAWNNKNQNKYLYPYGVEPPMATLPVLFIEEFVPPEQWSQSQYTTTDWRAYIFYDATKKCYVLNGTRRRRGESKSVHPDIHMTFASKSSLAFYLRKSTCAWRHDLSITMYSISRNVLHIISTPNAIANFHSIHNCRSKFRSELFGYDNCRPSTRELESYLKILRDGTEGIMFR